MARNSFRVGKGYFTVQHRIVSQINPLPPALAKEFPDYITTRGKGGRRRPQAAIIGSYTQILEISLSFLVFRHPSVFKSIMAFMNNRERALTEAFEHILRVLIAEYAPDKVILFGSLANRDVREWSDLDVVIVKDTAKPFPQRLREVALLCRSPVGVDFLVYTPREFAQMIADNNPFLIEEVLRKGKIVYESPASSAMA